MKKRKICVITGSRAEYGHLYWLMKEIKADKAMDLQVLVTGMHVSPQFGNTYREIEKDGFKINAKVKMPLLKDTPAGILKAMGKGLMGFAEALERLKPDAAVILGDRYEMLVAAEACLIAKIPIAHLHGGEATEGAFDESIRHAITKMSHLHFTAAKEYAARVIQMGEHPRTVFAFGAPGLDHLRHLRFLSKPELENKLGFRFKKPLFLITYHPVTLEKSGPAESLKALFGALDAFPHASIIFTKSNADPSGGIIPKMLEQYRKKNPARVLVVTSLGQQKYLSAMKLADCVIGNSSSGIIEAPALKKATVNLGRRQQGRLRASSIIDCKETKPAIERAIRLSLSAGFQKKARRAISLYGQGNVSKKIKQKLKSADWDSLLMKSFYAN